MTLKWLSSKWLNLFHRTLPIKISRSFTQTNQLRCVYSICHLYTLFRFHLMWVNKSSNLKCGLWFSPRFVSSLTCDDILKMGLSYISMWPNEKWTHFSYDWHYTVNQCLPKLLSMLWCLPYALSSFFSSSRLIHHSCFPFFSFFFS